MTLVRTVARVPSYSTVWISLVWVALTLTSGIPGLIGILLLLTYSTSLRK